MYFFKFCWIKCRIISLVKFCYIIIMNKQFSALDLSEIHLKYFVHLKYYIFKEYIQFKYRNSTNIKRTSNIIRFPVTKCCCQIEWKNIPFPIFHSPCLFQFVYTYIYFNSVGDLILFSRFKKKIFKNNCDLLRINFRKVQ